MQHDVFNIDNNKKCFLSTKSANKTDFWKIMWHWRIADFLLKNQALTWKEYIIFYYKLQ